MDSDPLTRVYEAIWAWLEEQPWIDRVKSGNRLSYTSDSRSPGKTLIGMGDLPELSVVPEGGAVGPTTGSTGQVVQRYTVQLSSGDLRLQTHYFPIKWELVMSLLKLRAGRETLPNADFVKKLEVGTFRDLGFKEDRSDILLGWYGTVTIDAHLAVRLDL